MPAANFGPYHVRKWFTIVEDTQANESGQPDGDPVRKIVIAAAVHNPYAGRFSADLSDIVATRGRLKARLGGLAARDITGTDGLR